MVLVVRAGKAVEVTLCHYVAELLVGGDCPAGEVLLLFAHILWLELHSETAGGCQVKAEFQWGDVSGLMVRNRRDVGTHGEGRVNETRAVLYENPAQALGVVAGPEFVEILHLSVVNPAAAGGAALDIYIRILGAYALEHLVEALHIIDVEASLVLEVFRAEAVHHAVAVPLDVVYARRGLHCPVEDAENEVLHIRIGHIQYPLVAFCRNLPFRGLHHPFRMLLGEFALRVHHFRLYPYSELQTLRVGVIRQVANAFRQFFHIHLPVSEALLVVVARVFVAEPAVVEHEEFETHRSRVVNHIRERLGVELEIGALPGVQQGRAETSVAVAAVIAGPVVEVAAHLACTPETVGPEHLRSVQFLSLSQRVAGGGRIDSGYDAQPVALVHLEVYAVVAGPGQGTTYGLSVTLAVVPEVQYEGRVLRVRGAGPHPVLYDLGAVGQELPVNLHLPGPGAVEMGEHILFGEYVYR